MTTRFQKTLSKIIAQEEVLKNADERAVELGVVLPILRSLDWDTEDIRQIYPQQGFDDHRDKIDYALKINDASRVLIEVKQWEVKLDDHRKKLLEYCIAAGIDVRRLAVLTNGHRWELYIAPDKSHDTLRLFLDFDITAENPKPKEIEKDLRKYLAFDKLSNIKAIPQAAYYAHNKIIQNAKNLSKAKQAWNRLVGSPKEQEKLLEQFAEIHGLNIDVEQFRKLLEPTNGRLFNPVADTSRSPKTQSKPSSFTLEAEDWKEDVQVKYWYEVHFELCKIMYNRHPDNFRDNALQISNAWFFESAKNDKDYLPISDSGVWIKKKGANAYSMKDLCKRIAAKFGSNYVWNVTEI